MTDQPTISTASQSSISSVDPTFILQAIVTLVFSVTLCAMWLVGQNPPSDLVLLTTGLVMYFFGGRSPASGVQQMAKAMQHFTLALPIA